MLRSLRSGIGLLVLVRDMRDREEMEERGELKSAWLHLQLLLKVHIVAWGVVGREWWVVSEDGESEILWCAYIEKASVLRV